MLVGTTRCSQANSIQDDLAGAILQLLTDQQLDTTRLRWVPADPIHRSRPDRVLLPLHFMLQVELNRCEEAPFLEWQLVTVETTDRVAAGRLAVISQDLTRTVAVLVERVHHALKGR
jgi:hypothetical protein